MSTMNRLANCTNRFQGPAKRVLCLCSAGLLRSPTMANVLHREFGYNTRAAGVSQGYALVPVDDVLIEWAEEIVCVEKDVLEQMPFSEYLGNKRVIVLNVPDKFSWGDPELQSIILMQYNNAVEAAIKEN